MNRRKKLLGLLIFCSLSAIACLFIAIWNRDDGILFLGSTVIWAASIIGIGFSIIELDKVSNYLDLHS